MAVGCIGSVARRQADFAGDRCWPKWSGAVRAIVPFRLVLAAADTTQPTGHYRAASFGRLSASDAPQTPRRPAVLYPSYGERYCRVGCRARLMRSLAAVADAARPIGRPQPALRST